MFDKSIINNVIVGEVVDAVEHHLVEKNCVFGEKKGASDCQRTSKDEVLV